ncbi:hypothetical protein ACFWB2_42430 [Streptomyces virginiae]|uniref:hypothetical protein n=1 Tax=Streptomyces TaxID=1883 RepID=UPI0013685CAA|nr:MULTISPECIES: hypothetical protein [Streptomyces]MCX4720638.1 hypothetical protein [Streptomyces virginiae]MCX5270371.1 hypothetical protein [Streptomyces virginiae]MYV75534.1 hypothetical protein [Streptomyces sp. SID1046]WSC76738.1 hypothetical protein OHA56_10565 [Streptomyces virginiae]
MRLRHAAGAAFGAVTLLLTMPTSASAATGEFQYTVSGLDGRPLRLVLENPPSGECITLPEVADPGASSPAHSPRNRTDEVALVFTEPDCTGREFALRPRTGYGSERLELRSVVFVRPE